MKKENMLVVEDEDIMREALVDYFSDGGHTVDTANDGEKALANKMAYITPSGKPPHKRIITTSRPIKKPYTKQPKEVIGDATISVAIKTAPSINPPENSIKMGEG